MMSNAPEGSTISGITEVFSLGGGFDDDPDHEKAGSDDGDSSSLVHRAHASSSTGDGGHKLVGRKKEQQQLEQIWNRISSSDPLLENSFSEIVWLTGPSGVGKSYLLSSVRDFVHRTNNGIFVSSKFDQLSAARREPFYAVVAALSDLCEIVSADHDHRGVVAKKLRRDLGLDVGLFCRFVPTMKDLISRRLDGSSGADRGAVDDDGGVESLTRIASACQAFLSCISEFRPVFLCLEDLQWADSDTTNLLQILIRNKSSKRLCFVLSAREGDPATKSAMESLGLPHTSLGEEKSESHPVSALLPRNELKVSNLSETEVCQMLCGLLDCAEEDPKTLSLTKVVHAKTSGNPFFVVQYLEMLRSQGFLHHSKENDRWVWDDLGKMTRLDVSDDVLKSIDARVYSLDARTRSALMIAAHLGYRFRIDVFETVVKTVLKKLYPTEDDENSLRSRFDRLVATAENASMLLRTTNHQNELCFMHDRVQQCFYEMFPDDGTSKQQLYLTIARHLRPMVDSQDDDESLKFLITDMWNTGRVLVTDEDEKTLMLKLNRDVSEIAKQKSSYSAASHYLQIAIGLLDRESMWSDRYELSLSLYSSFAMCLANAGFFEECDKAADVILSNASDVLDKQHAHKARIHSLGLQGRHEECVRVGIEAINELGFPMSHNPNMLLVVFQAVRNKSRMKKISDAALLSMPMLEDKRKVAMCDIIDGITASTFISSPNCFCSSTLRVLGSSLTDGISKATPFAVANFGMLEIAIFNKLSNAAKRAALSQSIIEKHDLQAAACGCQMLSHFFVLPWVRPWVDSIEPLRRAFEVGLKHGKLFFASSCLGMTSPMLLVSNSISESEEQLREVISTQIQLLEKSRDVLWTKPYLQQILNLRGCSDHLVELSGEAMQEEEFESDEPTLLAVANYHLRKLELSCYFGCHRLALKYLKLLEPAEKAYSIICPLVVSKNFFGGIT